MEIDEELFQKAWALSGIKMKRLFFEEALRVYVAVHEQAGIRRLRGKLVWDGDLDAVRGGDGGGRRAGRR